MPGCTQTIRKNFVHEKDLRNMNVCQFVQHLRELQEFESNFIQWRVLKIMHFLILYQGQLCFCLVIGTLEKEVIRQTNEKKNN